MLKLTLNKQIFNLENNDILWLFENLAGKDYSKGPRHLRNLLEILSNLPAKEFLETRIAISKNKIKLCKSASQLFDTIFDLLYLLDEQHKFFICEIAKKEHIQNHIQDYEILKKLTLESEFALEFFHIILKESKKHINEPKFNFVKNIFRKNKININSLSINEDESEFFKLALELFNINLTDAAKIISDETGELYFEMLVDLIDHGADTSEPLKHAVAKSNIEEVAYILKKDVDCNIYDRNGDPLIVIAAATGNAMIVDLLLQHNANPNLKNSQGNSALNNAIKNDNHLISTMLLLNNANINSIDANGFTPLINAIYQMDNFIINILLDYNPNFTIMGSLFKAGHEDIRHRYIDFLIQNNIEVSNYEKILSEFCKKLKDNTIKLKIENNKAKYIEEFTNRKNLNSKNLNLSKDLNEKSLMIGIIKNDPIAVEAALKNGANSDYINKTGSSGSNLIHLTSFRNNLNITKLLIDFGASVNSFDEHGNTALLIAICNENLNMVKLLLENNADPELLNDGGTSAIEAAEMRRNYDLINLIRSYMAK